MNRIPPVRRLATTLAALAGALLAFATAAPAALASGQPPVPPGWYKHPPLPPHRTGIHTVVASGMPGWQITLIAAGAALLAATTAVLLDRARNARRTRQYAAGQAIQAHTAAEASDRLRRAGTR
jgi:hypothetical protein